MAHVTREHLPRHSIPQAPSLFAPKRKQNQGPWSALWETPVVEYEGLPEPRTVVETTAEPQSPRPGPDLLRLSWTANGQVTYLAVRASVSASVKWVNSICPLKTSESVCGT